MTGLIDDLEGWFGTPSMYFVVAVAIVTALVILWVWGSKSWRD
jgi:hypothetical protein